MLLDYCFVQGLLGIKINKNGLELKYEGRFWSEIPIYSFYREKRICRSFIFSEEKEKIRE